MTTASVEHRVVNKSQATTHTPSLLRRARRVATTRATERRIGAERSSKLGGARARASVLGASANKDARTSSPSVAEIASSRDEGGATKQLAKAGQSALAALAVMSVAPDAFAKGGELGILEGRTIALIHPATMFSLLAATGYIGYLGWQWRRVRTIGEEISELPPNAMWIPPAAVEQSEREAWQRGGREKDEIGMWLNQQDEAGEPVRREQRE